MRCLIQKRNSLFLLVLLSLAIISFNTNIASASSSDGTIDNVYKYAWSEKAGWVNFGTTGGNVHITDSGITGYAWSSNYGWINMSPAGSGIKNNGEGYLSGYAWGENLGWINFDGVFIGQAGDFSGHASGDASGQINFDCKNCNVKTDWRPVNTRPSYGGGVATGLNFSSTQIPISNPVNNPETLPTSSKNNPSVTDQSSLPIVLEISSPTNPNQERWYNNPNPKFTWTLPSGVTKVRTLYDKYLKNQPTVVYAPPISEKEIKDVKDGMWYFHLQYMNSKGWGPISNFRFQIDTESPDFLSINEKKREDLTDPIVEFSFNATDTTSGISYYEIRIDGKNSQIWNGENNDSFKTPILEPGEHILTAKVFDEAGNFSEERSVKFTIQAREAPKKIIKIGPLNITPIMNWVSLVVKSIASMLNSFLARILNIF